MAHKLRYITLFVGSNPARPYGFGFQIALAGV